MDLIKQFKSLPTLQRITIIVSLLILMGSFTQPAFYVGRVDYDAWSNSFFLFFMGWTGILGGGIPSCLIWLANPMYIIAIYLILKDSDYCAYVALFAVLIALCFLFIGSILTSESGEMSKITVIKAGYILWLASFIVLFVGTAVNQHQQNNRNY